MDAKIIDEIIQIAGKENVLTSVEDRQCYAYDGRTDGVIPGLVVFPLSAGVVSGILKLANKYLFPVVPRGQGTGLTGGSIPLSDSVVLVFSRMNHILEVDTNNLIAVVEPGVSNFDLQQ
jgi:glycolate oxidase